MTIYVLDTDHLSLYSRNNPALIDRLRIQSVPLITTVINIEEQLRGRLAQIAAAKDDTILSNAYSLLSETVTFLSEFEALPFTKESQIIYRDLKAERIRIGTQDLRIASITLAHQGVLLTRNFRDFDQVPNLIFENWTN